MTSTRLRYHLTPTKLLTRTHRVRIKGSKSYTNRAIIIASLADGVSKISNFSPSDDSRVLMDVIGSLGINIIEEGDTITIHGTGGQLTPFQGEIDVGAAGTTMRFLTALFGVTPGHDVVLKGSNRMHERPISGLVESLQQLGASISYLGKPGCPPLRILGQSSLKQRCTVPVDVSSQYLSSLLLVSPLFRDGLTLTLSGTPVSRSYIDMTLSSMEAFGVRPTDYGEVIVTAPHSPYQARNYTIEGDASGASYLFGIAAIAGCTISVSPLPKHSKQGDIHFPELLQKMGCAVSYDEMEDSITVTGVTPPYAIECDMTRMPDTAQTLAVIASGARGTSHITGLSTLKVKETDRILALHQELKNIGIRSEISEDSLSIHGSVPHAGTIATYDDHRMAMSFAMLGSVLPNMIIEDPMVVTKSFPDFWECIQKLGIGVSEE